MISEEIKQKIDRAYYRIKDKCYNPKCLKYKLYGARGIKVCDEWLEDKNRFFEWCISSGIQKDLSIDRIDVNGNYEPSNCRWADNYTQARNKRWSIYITHNNISKTLKEWCEEYKVPYETAKNRYNKVKRENIQIDDRVFDLLFKPVFYFKGLEFVNMLKGENRERTHNQQRSLDYYYKHKKSIAKKAKQRYLKRKGKLGGDNGI